jgi:tryptophan synthase alpha chain
MIEIGIPFSDPLADGRTIQYSSQKALERGVNIDRTFHYLSELDGGFGTPLILMSYLNPINHYGIAKFAKRAFDVGVRGLIVPDLIPEEGRDIEDICSRNAIDLIYLLAPTSSRDRQRMILKRSRGFVYLVSVAGVTGARRSLPKDLGSWVRQVKRESSLPVCVGFGISNVGQARALSRVADGVIIGSAIIDKIRNTSSERKMIEQATGFMNDLRKGLDHG